MTPEGEFWSISEHFNAQFVDDWLKMALWRRRVLSWTQLKIFSGNVSRTVKFFEIFRFSKFFHETSSSIGHEIREFFWQKFFSRSCNTLTTLFFFPTKLLAKILIWKSAGQKIKISTPIMHTGLRCQNFRRDRADNVKISCFWCFVLLTISYRHFYLHRVWKGGLEEILKKISLKI